MCLGVEKKKNNERNEKKKTKHQTILQEATK